MNEHTPIWSRSIRNSITTIQMLDVEHLLPTNKPWTDCTLCLLFSLFNTAVCLCEKHLYRVYLSMWMSFTVCVPMSPLPPTLSAALADQQTNAASFDQALSHTAVFLFHVRPCCLPLWCQILCFFFCKWTFYTSPAELSRWMAGGMRVFPCHLLIICMNPPSWLKWSRCLQLVLWGLSHTRRTHTYENTHEFSGPHNNSLLQFG